MTTPTQKEVVRYGNAKVTTIWRDFDKLRQAIRTWDNEAIQEAWDKCERWLGFVHEAQALSARVAELEAERDEALNQLDSSRHDVTVLERRAKELLAQQSTAQGVRVKPLDWSFFDASTWWAETVGGLYRINERGDGAVILAKDADIMRYIDDHGDDWGGWPSIDHAKAAAQADYERRILSAIDHAPITAQQAAGVLLSSLNQDEWRGAIKPREFLTAIAIQEEGQ